MEDRRDEVRTVEVEDDRNRKGGLGWLKWLLPLLLLGLLLWYFLLRGSDDTNNNLTNGTSETTQSQTTESTDQQALKQKYEQQFAADARSIYFTPDTTTFQDEADATAKLDAIAKFYKDNPEAKLDVNGSIFDNDEVDANSQLAKDRAELVKDRLVEKGVSEDQITVSTIDRYEGQDEAARAQYARSVVVTVTN